MLVRKNKYLLISSFIVISLVQAHNKPIITLTVMKAGSHLLNKCIYLLTQGKKFFYTNNLKQDLPNTLLKDNLFCYTHIAHTKARERWLKRNKFTCFYIYRDPRDQLVSLVFYLYVAPWVKARMHPVFKKPVDQVPFNDLLMDLITDGSWLYSVIAGSVHVKSIGEFYRATLPWLSTHGICVVTFEELVGPLGGGSEELQLRSVERIARHLGIKNRDKQHLLSIARELFGATVPFGAQLPCNALEVIRSAQPFEHFRQGKIGTWKEYFTIEHKQAFKKVAGQLLIMLGYERDLSW
jgi:hypothetical protein